MWSYGGENLEVPCFTYLGLNFTRQILLVQMADEQAMKGKRVLVSIISRLYRYGQLTNNVFLAHLSRRLMGELMVYAGFRRPSVVNIFKRLLF